MGKTNVFVIGETGVGKSSLIRLLVSENPDDGNAEPIVSSAAARDTFEVKPYYSNGLCFYDTVGYNDSVESKLSHVFNLGKLLTLVQSEGISLILYVMKKGRITAASKENYDYFVKVLCKNQVDVILVVTHCESDIPGHDWFSMQKEKFSQYDMKFVEVVCGCAITVTPEIDPALKPVYEEKRELTCTKLKEKIARRALSRPWKPEPEETVGWTAMSMFRGLGRGAAISFISSAATLGLTFAVKKFRFSS